MVLSGIETGREPYKDLVDALRIPLGFIEMCGDGVSWKFSEAARLASDEISKGHTGESEATGHFRNLASAIINMGTDMEDFKTAASIAKLMGRLGNVGYRDVIIASYTYHLVQGGISAYGLQQCPESRHLRSRMDQIDWYLNPLTMNLLGIERLV